MTIKIHVTPDDLLETRFAYNPLVELAISYRVLRSPGKHRPYQKWVNEALRSLHGIDLPFMDTLLAPDARYIPDFLTPTPTTVQLHIEPEIEKLLALPDAVIRKNIEQLVLYVGESDILRFFLTYPHEALLCLVEELRLYWRRAMEPHWSSLTSILDGDVIYHARQMALNGPENMLNGLHTARIRFQDGVIELDKDCDSRCPDQYHLMGTGLQLVPSIFSGSGIHWQIEPEWHPMLIYSARGIGNWRADVVDRNPSLELALGEGRARVLQKLATPSNTGEIARQLEISASAASQHLSRLQQAGLVEPHRSGRRVYYQLTHRGAQLLTLFDQAI